MITCPRLFSRVATAEVANGSCTLLRRLVHASAPNLQHVLMGLMLGAALVSAPLHAGTNVISAPVRNEALRRGVTAEEETPIPAGAHEIVFIEGNVSDAHELARKLTPRIPAVILNPRADGLTQMIGALRGRQNLTAIHVVSHGAKANVNLGTLALTPTTLATRTRDLATLGRSLAPGGDLLLYGCAVAVGHEGQSFIAKLAQATGADVAASTDETGAVDKGGNWILEASSGRVATSALQLMDYHDLLTIITFSDTDADYSSMVITKTVGGRTLTFTGGTGFGGMGIDTSYGSDGLYSYEGTAGGNDIKLTISIENGYTFDIASFDVGVTSGSLTIALTYGNGSTATFTVSALDDAWQTLSSFGTPINDVKQVVLSSSDFGLLQNFDITDVKAYVALPTVNDSSISITSSGSGSGGIYKIGDTVTASWNNTAGGDNNSGITGVTMDFSQFGGGSAVVASNSSGTWTASYTIVAGAIDGSNKHVSVSATNSSGTTTTSDTTNLSVDNVAPTVTDAKISISGASGTAGAFKIGDTVTAIWNNTPGGENNSDTISGVTVDFSAFGGGSAVSAFNASGTWTASYTILSGVINGTTNRNISISARDNAGNVTTTADTTNATVDNVAPTITFSSPAFSADTGSSNSDFVTKTAAQTITATLSGAPAGNDIVYGSLDNGATWSNVSSKVSGTSLSWDGVTLSSSNTLKLKVTDAAGNDGTVASQAYMLDVTAPGAPSTPDMTSGTDTGSSSTDNITKNSTPTFTGTAESGSTVTLYDTDGTTVLGTATAIAGSWSITSSTLSAGSHTLVAKATDSAGNTSPASSGLVAAIDASAPTGIALNPTSIASANTTGASTIGTLSATDTLPIVFSLAVGNGTNDADNGSFTISGTSLKVGGSNLFAGTYKIYVAATDAAGNASNQAFTLTVADAPTVSSIVRTGGASSVVDASSTSVSYTVTFNESVTGVDTSDFSLTETGTASGSIASLSGSGTTYTVTVNAISGDGTLRLNLNSSGTGIQNGSTIDIAGGYTSGQTYTLDHTAPGVSNVTVPASATYVSGDSLKFTVFFNEMLSVSTTGGTPRLALTVGSATRYATLTTTGASQLVFTYVVQTGDFDADGVTIGALQLNGGTIKDTAGNDATLTLNSVASTAGVLIDAQAPQIVSIVRKTPTTQIMRTNSVVFAVTFSEDVTGVTADWFAVTPLNGSTVTATVGAITGGPSVYDVTVNISGGSGDFSLDVMTPSLTPTVFATGMTYSQGMAFDGTGNLFVINKSPDKVTKITADGSAISTFATGFHSPQLLAFDGTGTLYVSNSAPNSISKVTTGGSVSEFVTGGGTPPNGLAFDNDGNLYVADFGGGVVNRVTSAGVISVFATGFNCPWGLAFDSAGNLYVANNGDGTISKVTSGGAVSTFATGLNQPTGLAFDTSGNLYVTSLISSGIVSKVTADGTVSTFATGFSSPSGLAFDSAGNLYVLEYGASGKIFKLSLGVITDFSGNTLSGVPYTAGEVYTYDPNDTPTDIALSSSSINESAGAGAVVGTMSTTDADGSDAHSYSLVSGTGSTNNSSFVISGNTLKVGASALTAGTYAIRVQTNDGNGGTYEKSFSITVVDDVAANISSATVPSNATYGSGQNLDFTVNFSENITVNTGGGTPRIALTLDTGGTVYATYFSGSGTSALTFRYTIVPGNLDDNGITVASTIDLNGGTLKDAGDNNPSLSLSSIGSTAGVKVDGVVPMVSLIVRTSSAVTRASSLEYTVTFSENVSGVDSSDFALTTTGTATGTIAAVNAVDASTYTVTLNSVSGDGTLRLDLNSSGTGITDTGANAIAAGFGSGEIYSIDHTPPAIDTQPAGGTYIVGSSFNLSVGATDSHALTYRWALDGTPLSDAAHRSGSTTATLTHSNVGIVGFAGSYTVEITDAAGNTTTSSPAIVLIDKAPATVVLSGLSFSYDGSSKIPSATTTPNGLSVQFTFDGGSTAPTAAGSYAVVATIDDPVYQGTGSGTLIIAKADQSVTFSPESTLTVESPVTLSATSSSGLPVTFALVSGPAILSGTTLTATSAGTVVVRATQAGDANHNPASVDRSLVAGKISQTITFDALPDRQASDGPFALHATASSGLTVTFSVEGPASLSGSTVTLAGAPGTVTIHASQAGDTVYAAATEVTRSFNVGAIGPQVYFGETSEQDTIAANLAQDNTHGTLLGKRGGTGQAFVVEFTLNEDHTFNALATIFEAQAAPATSAITSPSRSFVRSAITERAVTLTFTGTVMNGLLTGSIVETGTTFTATIQPQSGPTANIAGYYTAPATDTSTGSTYTVVGTSGRVYVLAVTPGIVAVGNGNVDASGTFIVEASPNLTVAGQVNASTGTIASTLSLEDAEIDFSGIKTTEARTDRLVNLSTRGVVSSSEPLIAGFVISGTEPKRVLLRGVGPGLAKLGVSSTVPDPTLRLFNRQGQVILENDNWTGTDVVQASSQIGAFALENGSKDSALLVTLQPGVYTMHVSSNTGVAGVALAEVYDASETPPTVYQRLVNISSRATVGTGDNLLIGGFVVTGNSPKRLLIRGSGPSLVRLGVSGVLPDPSIRVVDRSGTLIARNNNWSEPMPIDAHQTSATAADISAGAAATGAFAFDANSKDAALIVTLNPGIYTVLLSDTNNATGNALVEIYELP